MTRLPGGPLAPRWRDRPEQIWVIAFWGVAALLVLGLAAGGQMRPWVSPDTTSWLEACDTLADCLSAPRLPLYRWLIVALPTDLLPWVQDGLFIAAAWSLAWSARRAGLSRAASLALGVAPLVSAEMLLWGRAILPEILAHAALLGALAAILRRRVLLAVAFGTLAWLLKPGFLPFLVILPMMLWLLGGHRRAAALLGGLLAPFLLLSGLRLAVVGDFNVVSFGGFQMSGMAALMLTPELVARLPADQQQAATAIIARRDALVASGAAIAVPLNSQGQRSFISAATGYFDLLARTHDDVLYNAVRPDRGAGEGWVAFNARMQRLALATLRAAPLSYVAWVVGASARLVGRLLVFNPGFLLGCAACLLSWLVRRSRPSPAPVAAPGDIDTLLALTLLTTLGASALIVLTTFPAARYIDGAGLLLAAWPIYGAVRAWLA